MRAAVTAALSVGTAAFLLPRVTGVPWMAITAALSRPTPVQIGLLGLLWVAGLAVNSRVLTAALPGLSVRRALTLNLTGSAVANVVPFGGGAGIGANYLMTRRWGFTARQFTLYTSAVNAWHLAAKALLPAVAVALLVADDTLVRRGLLLGALAASAVLLALVLLAATAVLTETGARLTGRAVDRVVRLVSRASTAGPGVAERLDLGRLAGRDLVRRAWQPMTVGVLGYNALQALLLWCCLSVVGAPLPLVAVVSVFAVERAATALPFTPGGSGVVEVSAAAAVVALGGPPAAAAAGVLLYRAFVFGLEIPVGGAWLLGWWVSQRGESALA